MALIELTQGKFAIVDEADYDLLNQFHWSLGSGGYPQRAVKLKKNVWRSRRMHHLLLPPKPGYMCDHINCNPLDNRRVNLRYATKSQNQRNQRKRTRKASSKYKGVHWCANVSKWRAMIKPSITSKSTHIGLFHSEREAALAYDAAAIKYHGEFVRLNFQTPCRS